jgi:hypothetical protein
MKPLTTAKLLLAAALALTLVSLAAAGPASARSRCAPHAGATASSCYPKRITGTFSGADSDYVWSGSLTLTRHRKQTIYLYSGKASVSWEHRDIQLGAGCTLAPANGAFTQSVSLQVNRVPDRRRGWSYASGGSGQGDTGPEYSDCQGDRLSNGHGMIDDLFGFGGFTRNLRRFAGEDRQTSTYHHAWLLRGRG